MCAYRVHVYACVRIVCVCAPVYACGYPHAYTRLPVGVPARLFAYGFPRFANVNPTISAGAGGVGAYVILCSNHLYTKKANIQ